MAILFGMMLLGTADVMGRYLFNSPVTGTYEYFGVLLACIVLLGLAYTQAARGHVRIELVVSRLPSRLQTIFGFFTTIIALFISVLIFWEGLELVISNWHLGRLVQTIQVPLFIPRMFVPLGALVLCFVLLVQILQYIDKMRQRS